MAEQIIVGPINKGLKTDREPFIIDNDSFPTLINAYQWRGRIKRKRGTKFLGRLNRFFSSGSSTITLSSGSGNLLSGFSIPQANATLVPGSITITDTVTGLIYTDPNSDGNLYNVIATITGATQANPCVLTAKNNFPSTGSVSISGVGGMTQLNGNTYTIVSRNPTTITINVNSTAFGAYTSGGTATYVGMASVAGTINYSTGAFTITGAGSDTATATFSYYPDLPVMGIRDFRQKQTNQASIDVPAICIAFDTVYSYEVAPTLNGANYPIYDVSFYKNPAPNSFGTSNPQKTNWTPITWSGADYQQFWTTNFQSAMWATNGTPGMQFQNMTSISIMDATTLVIVVPANTNVQIGDWIFVNETGNTTVDQQTGYVSAVGGSTTLTVICPFANMYGMVSPGMIQYLTNRSPFQPSGMGDGIRWYDGDPTAGGTYPPTLPVGWVNYAPPLSQGNFSIGGAPAAQYYLVGATMIYPFRDFLIFVGPYIATSSATWAPIWLQDTIIFMANGTPYYTASYDNSSNPYTFKNTYHALLVPTNKTAYPMVGWEDVTGFGGFISSGVAQPITTLVPNEDVLILGYPDAFTRLIYTGNNLIPFLFYRINTELGASSTFSAIIFDKGSFTTGNYGICLTTQVASQRVDLAIPDQVFKINFLNNGYQRVCAGRDYINEWLYITYPSNQIAWKFPNQSLMYNYREDTWALHNEVYTAYGDFYPETGNTWASIKEEWGGYNETWNSSVASVGNSELVGGNQQGFLLIRNNSTNEASSLFVQAINLSNGQITSPDHCLNGTDPYSGAANYVIFNGLLGTLVDENGNNPNGRIYKVVGPIMEDTFNTSPRINGGGTYLGGGTITRAYVPYIQTKQFPPSWSNSRKTILGNQKYLFTRTDNGQITLNIFLSTDATTPYNDPAQNDGIIYSQVLYTCPESTNFGLTPANTNLQQINKIGSGTSATITAITNANPAVITANNSFAVGQYVFISGVVGMHQMNNNSYLITAVSPTTITISVDSRNFSSYVSGGVATFFSTSNNQSQIWHRMNTSLIGDTVQVGFTLSPDQMLDPSFSNQFAEIECHAMIFDVRPGGLLA